MQTRNDYPWIYRSLQNNNTFEETKKPGKVQRVIVPARSRFLKKSFQGPCGAYHTICMICWRLRAPRLLDALVKFTLGTASDSTTTAIHSSAGYGNQQLRTGSGLVRINRNGLYHELATDRLIGYCFPRAAKPTHAQRRCCTRCAASSTQCTTYTAHKTTQTAALPWLLHSPMSRVQGCHYV